MGDQRFCMASHLVFTPLPHNSHQRPPHFLSPHKTLWPRFAATIFLSLVCAECILYSLYNSSISLLATLWEGQIMITGQFCSLSMFLVFVAHFTFPCPLSSHLDSNLLGGGGGLTQLIFRSRLTKWILTRGQPLPRESCQFLTKFLQTQQLERISDHLFWDTNTTVCVMTLGIWSWIKRSWVS